MITFGLISVEDFGVAEWQYDQSKTLNRVSRLPEAISYSDSATPPKFYVLSLIFAPPSQGESV